MRKSFITLIASALIIACNNESEPAIEKQISDLASENLKGSIESYMETPYQADTTGKLGDPDSCCIGLAKIDKDGNYITWTEKDSKGAVKNEYTYTRFDNGFWKGVSTTSEGKPVSSFEATINDSLHYTGGKSFDSTGKQDRYFTDIGQNSFGLILSWKEYDTDSVFRQEGQMEYDSIFQKSNVIKDSVGNIKSSRTSKYNDKGEQIETVVTTVTGDSTTTKTTTYSYDAHDDMGNWTQRTEYDDKGKPVKIVKRSYTYYKKEE